MPQARNEAGWQGGAEANGRLSLKTPKSVRAAEKFSRTRLSQSFFMRDFLFSEIAAIEGLSNLPDDPELAIAAGRGLCENLLEPLQATFGRIAIRSAYRSPEVNDFGRRHRLSCASNEKNRARHTWDRRSKDGRMGALTTIVVPWLVDREWTRRAGKQWHGGFMTIFHTASCNSFRSCSLSISVGTRHRSGRSTASSNRVAFSRNRDSRTTIAITAIATKVSRS